MQPTFLCFDPNRISTPHLIFVRSWLEATWREKNVGWSDWDWCTEKWIAIYQYSICSRYQSQCNDWLGKIYKNNFSRGNFDEKCLQSDVLFQIVPLKVQKDFQSFLKILKKKNYGWSCVESVYLKITKTLFATNISKIGALLIILLLLIFMHQQGHTGRLIHILFFIWWLNGCFVSKK